jgi:hypothetical protein
MFGLGDNDIVWTYIMFVWFIFIIVYFISQMSKSVVGDEIQYILLLYKNCSRKVFRLTRKLVSKVKGNLVY